MRHLALAPDNPVRIAFPLRWVDGAEAYLHQMALRMSTVVGTWPDDAQYGLGYHNLPTANIDFLRSYVFAQASMVAPNAVRVLRADVERQGSTVQISITIQVTLEDGTVQMGQINLLPDDSYQPGAWLKLLPIGEATNILSFKHC